jgi:hypothetical protein
MNFLRVSFAFLRVSSAQQTPFTRQLPDFTTKLTFRHPSILKKQSEMAGKVEVF